MWLTSLACVNGAAGRSRVSLARALVFVGLNGFIVWAYCNAMAGRLEPLKHHPEEFVTRPLMVITIVVSLALFPLLSGQRSRLIRGVLLYFGFVLISAIYGIYLGSRFPDATPLGAVLLTLVGGHLYGWPPFLAILLAQMALDRWLFPSRAEEPTIAVRE